MKCKLITTASNYDKTEILRQSLDKFNWDYHIITHYWQGFGDKILKTYYYLKENPDITHFFYSDSYDTIALDTMENTLAKIPNKDIILLSAERACYPHPEKEEFYPKHDSPFHFVNGGGWFCNSQMFIELVEKDKPEQETVDQVWFTDQFLKGFCFIKLDYLCDVFQTIAFCPETDFSEMTKNTGDNFNEYQNKYILNNITGSFPTFIHGNGHTPMDRFNKLI